MKNTRATLGQEHKNRLFISKKCLTRSDELELRRFINNDFFNVRAVCDVNTRPSRMGKHLSLSHDGASNS